MIPKLKLLESKKQRKTFYASDSQRLEADLWLEFKGFEPTNPPSWQDSLKWSAGKAVELQMLQILKDNGHVDPSFDQNIAPSLKLERYGITVSMRPDAILLQSTLHGDEISLPQGVRLDIEAGEILEIKSINNKNSFDIQKYIDNYPRENYVMQLAFYMEALGKERSYLFVSAIDGLNVFWFTCTKLPDGKYQCGNTVVDIDAEMKRFAEIWRKLQNDEEPNWKEELYKLPIDSIDWKQQSNTAISAARTNKKVIGSEGSFKLLYSPFCDYILEKQGITKRGYTDEEVEKIVAATKGYSSKSK